MNPKAIKKSIRDHAVALHSQTPGLRQLPLPAVAIIVGLVVANALAWAGVGIALVGKNVVTLIDQTLSPWCSMLMGTRSTIKNSSPALLIMECYIQSASLYRCPGLHVGP